MEKGNFAPSTVSVGDVFAGALLPGLMLVGLYLLWLAFKAMKDPDSCPALEISAEVRAAGRDVLTSLIPPLLWW